MTAKVSRDVTHKEEGFLRGKSVEEIFKAHNGGNAPHQGDGCECAHCEEFKTRQK